MPIKLTSILDLENTSSYKLHLACISQDGIHPLDAYIEDKNAWKGWNEYRGQRNDWSRDLVFSLIEFYPKVDAWLFGGVFRVVKRLKAKYVLTEESKYQEYVGRLLIRFHRYQGLRGRAYYFEKFVDQFEVMEILPEPYTGERFCGYENICHDFNTLETIYRTGKPDWKAALGVIKGIYLIVDRSNGKAYVGSAYGEGGVWDRWAGYLAFGHGGNDELCELIMKKGAAYARENFVFSLLEVINSSQETEKVIERENHWKDVLLTRLHGYNRN